MSNSSIIDPQGNCPTPFFQETQFPTTGGFVAGRLCLPTPTLVGSISCCLPCPATDWTYSDGFEQRTEIASWINVATLVTTVFLLLSFIVLPVKWTHRHYLSICLAAGVGFIELAFLIPLAAKPEQCHNQITPNDMQSDMTCAFSGAFLLFGGWTAVMWVFLRALSLHLQICWEVIPGKKFFYGALAAGWIIPAIALALALSLTGVSYRFGNVCHINHKDGLQDFWGPLLGFGALALLFQFSTLGYCIKVYVKNLVDDQPTTESSGNVTSYSGSVRTATARQAYKRVRRVIQLQWKGIAVVLLIIADVVFFSIVFLKMDNNLQINVNNAKSVGKVMPWLECLVFAGGDKNSCLNLASGLVEKEAIILAVLIMLGMSGFWCLIFLGRWAMVLGWIDLIKRKLTNRHEFVSADARRLSQDPRTYEMLSSGTPQPDLKSPESAVTSPLSYRSTPFSPEAESKADYFAQGKKAYISPNSYSQPRPPSSGQVRAWDPRSTHARSNAPPGAELSRNFSM